MIGARMIEKSLHPDPPARRAAPPRSPPPSPPSPPSPPPPLPSPPAGGAQAAPGEAHGDGVLGIVETDVPARLDALPWTGFHTLVVIALGITWTLDGLEVTLTGSLSGVLKDQAALGLDNTEVGAASSAYLVGAVLGALFFGWLTDRLGRKKLFLVTLAIYLAATAATGLSWSFASFALFRAATGAGIGGEAAAIASTIQELVPARYRGWTDLVINGSFWIGAAIGASGSIVLLDPAVIATAIGWRLAFMIGAVLGLGIFVMRLWIPESPRWLMTHGDPRRAEAIVADIERRWGRRPGGPSGGPSSNGVGTAASGLPKVRLMMRTHTPLAEVARTLFRTYTRRTLVGLSLMVAQAFFYNAVFFTYALILTDFYNVPADGVGWYIVPFAAGNFLGPVLLGRLFDTLGRRIMIAATYTIAGILLAGSGYLFGNDLLSASQLTVAWTVTFFFASAAASSAYLTVSEIFPLEVRALAIAVFYAVGTAIGGVAAPWLMGALIDTGSRTSVSFGYLLACVLMLGAAVVEWRWGIAAERRSLEQVCRPLALVD